jgi:hypothetical protein
VPPAAEAMRPALSPTAPVNLDEQVLDPGFQQLAGISVAMDRSGRFAVTWNALFDYPDGHAGSEIRMQRFSADGFKDRDVVTVGKSQSELHLRGPTIAFGPQGQSFVLFGDYLGNRRSFIQRYDSAGLPLGGACVVLSRQTLQANRIVESFDVGSGGQGAILYVGPGLTFGHT